MDSASLVGRREHNASLGIAKLPTELLTEIFHICVVALFPSRETYLFLERLCEVCLGWQSVVCAAPKLWAFAASRWPLIKIDRALRLSGNHPLDIHEYNDTPEGFLPVLLRSSRRWRSARILTPDLQDDTSLALLRDLDAPQLERLSIQELVECNIQINLRDGTQLHTLQLAGRSICWDPNVFVGLRRLGLNGDTGCLPPLNDLLTVLQDCPLLEYLDIDAWSLPESADPCLPIGEVRTPIIMHRLQTLLLEAPWDYVAKVLEHVQLPALAKGSFTWDDTFSHSCISHAALVALMSSLVFSIIPPGSWRLTINSNNHIFKFRNGDREVTAQLDLTFAHHPESGFAPFVRDFLEAVRERPIAWKRPYLHTDWDSVRDVALDRLLPFEEVALIERNWGPDTFSAFIGMMKSPFTLPSRCDRWLFHAMDTLRIDYLENLTHEMSSLVGEMICERERHASIEGQEAKEYRPRPLKTLQLIGPTEPDEEILSSLRGTFRAGVVDWYEGHLQKDGEYAMANSH